MKMTTDGFLLYNNVYDPQAVTAFTTLRSVGRDRMKICSMLGIDDNHLVYPHQTHGTVIRQIGCEFTTLQPDTKKMLLEGVDAVTTNVPGICVAVSTADCIPVIIYDPVNHAAAAVHAGWRGTVRRIIRRTAAHMADTYGTSRNDIQCVIGPGISQENFEVGDEVYAEFANAGFPMERIAVRKEKYHIDLWEANRAELESMGVPPGNIYIKGVCTYAHNNDYFSARHDGAGTGRMLNGIILKTKH